MSDTEDDPAVWWVAGDSTAELLDRLDQLDASPPAAKLTSLGSGPARVGIVEPNERKLRLARRMLTEGEPWRGRSDLWFTARGLADGGGKVAFLFPGVEPTFGLVDDDLTGLARRLHLDAPALVDDSVAHRSASIVRLGIFLDQVLRRLGVAPDALAGHSIGEWGASVASGMFARQDADRLLDGIDLGGVDLPDLDFVALSAGADAVAPVIAGIEHVVVSHDNCPGQTVVCGPPAAAQQALAALRDAGILGYTLDFQSGFHTPFIEPSLVEFRHYLEGMSITAAGTPTWSATTTGPYPTDRAEIIELHLRHLVEPVRFRPMVERLYHEAGVRIFVQVGVGTLTGFVDDTLADLDHATVPAVTAKRSALAQAWRTLTALWVEGVAVRPEALTGIEPPSLKENDPIPVVSLQGPVAVRGAIDLLSAATRASGDVLDALAARLSPATAATATAVALAERPLPAPVAPATLPWPTEKVTVTRRLSIEAMPETLDHALYHQPEGWPDVTDGFPIVAMTTQIQLLQDVAAEYAGGRDVVEVFGVRNLRWLDLSDPQDVDITIVPKGDDVLSVALGPYCRANVRVGSFPPAPRHETSPLANAHVPKVTAEEMFAKRIMFHGPKFQGIDTLGPTGDDGILAEFHHLDTPGSLLDNLGKIIAYWVIEQRNPGESPLPIGVDRIQFFGPPLEPGVDVHCDVRIQELQLDLVKADGVLVLPDGRVWCRVEGWMSNVFHIDQVMEPVYHLTETHYADEPQPGGWSVTIERWPTGAGRDLTGRRFLSRAERERYAGMNLLEQRRWLIDLVTAKEAVRRWLGEHHGIESYPVQVSLVAEGEHRYRAVCPLIPEGHDLRITVSTLNWLAVAVLGDGEWRDIETREVVDGADAAVVAEEAAAALRARNPGVEVQSVPEAPDVTPSSIAIVVIPRFAVAWTP
ncbi:MAG TPA: acyltransferase domain-containing protein [Acidimicrobiales bacterium]|nr:acyltransferase domain-containing protein [Acidimicrobiales bacterium]